MLSENKIGYALDAESTQNLYQFIGSGKKKNTKTRRKKYKKRSKTYTKTLWTGPTIPILSLNSL